MYICICMKMVEEGPWDVGGKLSCALLKRKTSEVNICLSNCCGDCQLQRGLGWEMAEEEVVEMEMETELEMWVV